MGIVCEDVDCIHVAQDRIQWRVLVNMVMKFHVPKKEFLDQLGLVSYCCGLLCPYTSKA